MFLFLVCVCSWVYVFVLCVYVCVYVYDCCIGLPAACCHPSAPKFMAQTERRLPVSFLAGTMAAVDSFCLLYREIARSCNCYMEALAVVGAWYTARKSITVICDFYNLVRLHFIPRLVSRPDLIKQYGRWAVVSGEQCWVRAGSPGSVEGVVVSAICRSGDLLRNVSDGT